MSTPRTGRLWIADGLLVTPTGRDVRVEYGSILVENGCIARISPRGSPHPVDAHVLNAADMIVIPGLVNAHIHSHGVLSKWVVDTLPLEMWSPYVAAGRIGMTPEEARLAALLGGIECLRSGVTTVLDHPVYDTVLFDAAAQAYLDLGIRAAMAPSVMDRPYFETIPQPGREVPQELQRSLWAAPQPSVQSLLDLTTHCIKRWQGAGDRISILVGPSAPQRCSAELLNGLRQLAREFEVGIHTHLLETRAQALLAQRDYGMSMTTYLKKLGLLTDMLSVAHAVWVGDEDVRDLSESGATVVHNPLSNLTLGSGIMPLLALREAGIRIALGTDSPNSGGHHSLFESMRLATALPRAIEFDPDRWVKPEESFGYATLGGAGAVGLESRIGSIEPGKEADLVLLKRRSASLTPLNHVIRQLVFCEQGDSVDTVLVRGQIVVRDRRLQTIDEESILTEAQRAAERLLARNRTHFDWARKQEVYTRAVHNAVEEAPTPEPLWQKRRGY